MPNWSYNCFTISGEREAVIEAAKAMVGKRKSIISLREMIEKRGITYNTDISTVPDYRDIYNQTMKEALEKVRTEDLSKEELELTMNIVVPMPEICYVDTQGVTHPDSYNHINNWFQSEDSWYGWSIKNWGTKWDLCGYDIDQFLEELKEIEESNDEIVSINFDNRTAWSPPEPFIKAASIKFPKVTFEYRYEEESGAFYCEGKWEDGVETVHIDTSSSIEWYIYQDRPIYDILEERTCGFDDEYVEELNTDDDIETIIKLLLGKRSIDAIEQDINDSFSYFEKDDKAYKLKEKFLTELKKQTQEKQNGTTGL